MFRLVITLLKELFKARKKYAEIVKYIERKHTYTHAMHMNATSSCVKEKSAIELDVTRPILNFIHDLEEKDNGEL